MPAESQGSNRRSREEGYQSERDHPRLQTPAARKSSYALRKTLASLARFDLTAHVRYDSAVMKAHGGYCDVFIGSARISSPDSPPSEECRVVKVAIKRLRVHLQSDQDFAKLLAKELHIWSKLKHANILPFLGYVLEGDYPSVVSEWIENGTVWRYMEENPACDPGPLILGIANGVEYLHRNGIVHADLKADNVLVGRSGEPLICDFGISRMLASSLSIAGTSTGGLRGSVRWMALELFDVSGDAHHTKETDVWAFGMTIYEILVKELPYHRLRIDVLVMFSILRGELPSRPSDFVDWSPYLQSVWNICEECWVSPPEHRITMNQIVTSLKAIKYVNVTNITRASCGGNLPVTTSFIPATMVATANEDESSACLGLVRIADKAEDNSHRRGQHGRQRQENSPSDAASSLESFNNVGSSVRWRLNTLKSVSIDNGEDKEEGGPYSPELGSDCTVIALPPPNCSRLCLTSTSLHSSPQQELIPLSPHTLSGMLCDHSDYCQPRHSHSPVSYLFSEEAPMDMNPAYFLSMSVHPLLKDAQYTHLELSSPSYAPQTPDISSTSRSYTPIHEGYLSQVASFPGVAAIKLRCKAFGSFTEAWEIRIGNGSESVLVGDVLRTVHEELHTRVTLAEWSRLSESEAYEAILAYSRRCRAAGEFEMLQSVRRVDLLGKDVWFGGLKKVREDDPHNFELLIKAEQFEVCLSPFPKTQS